MARGYRFAARPAWIAGHVAVVAGVVTMVLLGHWQLSVSERKDFSLQNFGYALQWWAFAVFSVVFWAKIVRDYGRADVDSGSHSRPSPRARRGTGRLPSLRDAAEHGHLGRQTRRRRARRVQRVPAFAVGRAMSTASDLVAQPPVPPSGSPPRRAGSRRSG